MVNILVCFNFAKLPGSSLLAWIAFSKIAVQNAIDCGILNICNDSTIKVKGEVAKATIKLAPIGSLLRV